MLHLIPKFILIMSVDACKARYNNQVKASEERNLYSFSTGIITLDC